MASTSCLSAEGLGCSGRYIMSQRGTVIIHLDRLLKEAGLSKSKFCQKAEIQYSQLNGYLTNTITRLDTDVLARMCDVLHCNIADLLEYRPK